MTALTGRELAQLRAIKRLRDDYPLYAAECLRIRLKVGGTAEPFRLNASQRYLHDKCEDQIKRTGKVRKIILKARQVGISTYIGGRIYQKTTMRRGVRAYILAHEEKATDNLFGMVARFHENCPQEVRPVTGAASAKELSFAELDSDYRVGTAGNKAAGRSETIQLFHGSEVGFWPNAEDHLAGIMQAIADAPGTEVYLESTANGVGGSFHTLWKKAERGESDFEPVFIPWFMHEEYRKAVPQGWSPPPAFQEYGEIYKLSREQVYWAWSKNLETASDADEFSWQFRQEYPANADEAFQTSGANQFIKPEAVLRARKRKITGNGPLILGVDPARGGNDRMGIIDRQGRVIGAHVCERVLTSKRQAENAGKVVEIVKRLRSKGLPLRKIVVDVTDGGAVYDHLVEVLGDELVEGVSFGEAAAHRDNYANRRAEMWDLMRQWFDDPVGVQCPDRDDFHADMTCTAWGPGQTHYRPNGQLVLEPKEKIKDRLKVSPDLGDAAALTFAIDFSELREPAAAAPANRLGAAGWLT